MTDETTVVTEDGSVPRKREIVMLTLGTDRRYIFAEFLSDQDDSLCVLHPMQLTLRENPNGDGFGLFICDYMPFAQDRIVSIAKQCIHATAIPTMGMMEYYLKYRAQSLKENQSEYLESQITGIGDPDSVEFDSSPAGPEDVKH